MKRPPAAAAAREVVRRPVRIDFVDVDVDDARRTRRRVLIGVDVNNHRRRGRCGRRFGAAALFWLRRWLVLVVVVHSRAAVVRTLE